MRTTSTIENLRRRVRAFGRSENGNVATMFAIAMIPIIGFTGAAVDYSRASSVRAAMQAALDATALAMSKEAAKLSSSDLNQKAAEYFAAAFDRSDAQNVQISAVYNAGGNGSSVTISGSASVSTQFMGILGINNLPVSSSASTAWGMSKLRIALVLDNSGSMASGGRMSALKTATKNLLTQLQDATTSPGDVHVAIVPFNKSVNVGASNYNQSWLTWSGWENVNGTCSKDWYKTKSDCLANSKIWTANDHTTWNGCVVDRDQDYDVVNTAPTPSDPKTLFPADQSKPCPEEIMPLNYNWASLKAKVDAMASDGYTNQPIGLVWGWHALSTKQPMNAPAINDKKTQQFIILLSDGENTRDRWYDGWGAEAAINARQKMVCDNIKAAGIQIYSVLLIDGNESVMKDCASKPDMFFKLNSSNQVISAFTTIGTNLAKLRIAK